MLKNGVLDPQGKAIGHALAALGFEGVGEVRQGKVIDLEETQIDPQALKKVPRDMIVRMQSLPISLQGTTLTVATANPTERVIPRKVTKKWALVLMHPSWFDEIPIERQIRGIITALEDFHGEIIWIYPNSDEGSNVFIKNIEEFSKTNKCKLFTNRNNRASKVR